MHFSRVAKAKGEVLGDCRNTVMPMTVFGAVKRFEDRRGASYRFRRASGHSSNATTSGIINNI